MSLLCPGGLKGGTITIDGLAATMTDVLVRIDRTDGTTQVARLIQSVPALVVDASPGRLQVARVYSALGVEHILTGVDHLLFVLALIIITRGGWKLAKTVTAFTLSHSITLTAATLGFVHVPQRPVEAVIALSIVFVAAEILRMRRGITSITISEPWMVALFFGLIHGLGFAGGLSDAGLPVAHIPTALLFFSLGVESGHFLFIGVVLSSIALVARVRIPSPRWTELIPPYAIGAIAMFWVIQRTISILAF
jgi:hydrogenase/urease accessory protein HupE